MSAKEEKIHFIGENNQGMIAEMCIFPALLISTRVYIIFSGKSRKTSVVFPNMLSENWQINRV